MASGVVVYIPVLRFETIYKKFIFFGLIYFFLALVYLNSPVLRKLVMGDVVVLKFVEVMK